LVVAGGGGFCWDDPQQAVTPDARSKTTVNWTEFMSAPLSSLDGDTGIVQRA
jgi:hypothetical protein